MVVSCDEDGSAEWNFPKGNYIPSSTDHGPLWGPLGGWLNDDFALAPEGTITRLLDLARMICIRAGLVRPINEF